MVITNDDVLTFLQSSGMLDLATVQEQIVAMKEQQYLEDNHTAKIWQGSNGYYYTYLGDGVGRKLVRKKVLKDLQKAIIKYYDNANNPTFESVFYEWIHSKADYGEVQHQTIDRYIADYTRYIKGSVIAQEQMRKITEIELEDFIKRTIHEMALTPHGWANMRIIINGTIKYGKKHGYTDIHMRTFLDELDLSRKAFRRTVKNDDEQVFTKTEEDNIKNFIKSKTPCMTNLGILFVFETGLRIGELSTLMPKDIENNMLNVCRTEIRYKVNGHNVKTVRESTKGRDGYRKIVLTQTAQSILKEARLINPFGEFIFMQDGKRIPGNNYTMKLVRICKQLGITPRSMHKIRKTYATNLLDAGVDEKLIEKQMGHTDISTTRKYYYFDNHSVDEAVNQIESALRNQK